VQIFKYCSFIVLNMLDLEKIKSKVFVFIEKNGPVLPVQIAKEIENNSIFAGAILSELVRNKKILVSYAKVGGSPVYYVPAQKPKLERLYKYLKEKERKIFDLLKKEKVLKDTLIEPWQRVAVRSIKDFSVKLAVASTGEIFWKWYSVPISQAEEMIKKISERAGRRRSQRAEIIKPGNAEMNIGVSKSIEARQGQEGQGTLADSMKGLVGPAKMIKEIGIVRKPIEVNPKKKDSGEEIMNSLRVYLNGKSAEIVEEKVVRKKKDVEIIVKIPTSIGLVHFFVKFKDKKKINDAELSLAQTKAKSKNCSLIFLTTGELTKKARVYAEKHHIIFKKKSSG